ncbi:unnamed protein product [Effrenium voratum]|uniref:Uncharacterized protein n=1 Tax=Effrenium voratum TaxID=2562239 RepID=A0AA36HTV0_9DINO|nr:unnamed protein product [Effrenium voratum]CAJ1442531.1 unnamed protein product [Effrenium voratum]
MKLEDQVVYGEDNVSQEECRSLNDFNFGFILGGCDLLLDVPMSTSWTSMPPELAPSHLATWTSSSTPLLPEDHVPDPVCEKELKPWARYGSGRCWTVAGS